MIAIFIGDFWWPGKVSMHVEQAFSNEPVFSNHCSPGNMKRPTREQRAYYDASTIAEVTSAECESQGRLFLRRSEIGE